jgi:hypothetical protein
MLCQTVTPPYSLLLGRGGRREVAARRRRVRPVLPRRRAVPAVAGALLPRLPHQRPEASHRERPPPKLPGAWAAFALNKLSVG